MRINNNLDKCCKPRRLGYFTGNEKSDADNKKLRYKHFEQMNDDVLCLTSIIKAHQQVEKSGKMQLFKALPSITLGLIGTSIAIAQPGKLAAKAGAGLGFLMLAKGINFVNDALSPMVNNAVDLRKKEDESPNKTSFKKAALLTGLSVFSVCAAVSLFKGVSKLKMFEPVANFAKKEVSLLANELNNTKLAKFVEKNITLPAKKSPKLAQSLELAAPFGIIALGTYSQLKLADSLSNDIKVKANENYNKGKKIQQLAKEHFDSIDAKEI